MSHNAQIPTPVKLSNATLGELPSSIDRPRYDRSKLTPGIVHIGLGNFHRAHQAWYLHRLMQQGLALDWAIIGAGVRSYDAAMRESLLAQDCLTTLIELDPARITLEVTGPMIDYLPIEDGNGPLIRQMADPAIRIVSLTVTEGGHFLDPKTGQFDADHPDIRHDAAYPDRPKTVFGAMVAALKLRRKAGHRPFTAQSCDNLQGNGDILRQCVVGTARLSDPDLAEWIDANGAFPNSMVDCIVPATSDATREQVRSFGVDDQAPVSHENFRQWVIEDSFCAGRPPWEKVGATITGDVHSYETMKLRILNGGHQLLANAGELLGIGTICDCMADPDVAAFFQKVQSQEIVPFVDAVPEIAPDAYLSLIIQRFSNPEIRDSVRRVAFDGSSRHPGFLFASLRDGLAAKAPVEGLALAEALWARMCFGTREDGSIIEPNDPDWTALQGAAEAARTDPSAWLDQKLYAGLRDDPAFSESFTRWLSALWTDGCRKTIQHFAGLS